MTLFILLSRQIALVVHLLNEKFQMTQYHECRFSQCLQMQLIRREKNRKKFHWNHTFCYLLFIFFCCFLLLLLFFHFVRILHTFSIYIDSFLSFGYQMSFANISRLYKRWLFTIWLKNKLRHNINWKKHVRLHKCNFLLFRNDVSFQLCQWLFICCVGYLRKEMFVLTSFSKKAHTWCLIDIFAGSLGFWSEFRAPCAIVQFPNID